MAGKRKRTVTLSELSKRSTSKVSSTKSRGFFERTTSIQHDKFGDQEKEVKKHNFLRRTSKPIDINKKRDVRLPNKPIKIALGKWKDGKFIHTSTNLKVDLTGEQSPQYNEDFVQFAKQQHNESLDLRVGREFR